MKQIAIKLATMAPLSTRANHALASAGASEYIAGNTVLGGLAAAHRFSYPDKTDEFERLFLRGRILYPNLYPAVVDRDASDWQDIHLPVYPLPKTAQSCKRWSGFRHPMTVENDGHGVRDTLIDWAVFRCAMQAAVAASSIEPTAGLRAYKKCPVCGEPMHRCDGYYRRSDVRNIMLATNVRATRLRTHVGVDRESRAEQASARYSRQVFEEGTTFWGTIKLLDDDLLDGCQAFLAEVGATGLVRIGMDRTRGMGKVNIEIAESVVGEQERRASFMERMEDFNTLLSSALARWGVANFQHAYFFSVTLHSPAILNDAFLRYYGAIDAALLRTLLAIPALEIERVYYNASTRLVMGWQELWGTPRPNEYAIDTGSVFLFRCSAPPDRFVREALFTLEEQGVGKRRAEGFGRVRISDPFHKEVSPR